MLSFVLYLLLLGPLASNGDEGVGLDPFGISVTAACGDGGWLIDPNGRCSQAQLNTDDGNGFDPHG